MTFERPDLLVFAPLLTLVVVAAILWQWRRSVRLVKAYGGREVARRLTGRLLGGFPAARLGCAALATLALVLAASGVRPDAGEPPPPVTPVDLVVALDVSHSMTATDVEPTRFDVARGTLDRLLDARVADRVALSLFAGWPYGLVPVTEDPDVVEYFSPWVEPRLLAQRDQGTALAEVVDHAVETWQARARDDAVPVLLVISDGEAHGAAPEVLAAISRATDAGLRVWTAGVGTAEGAPLFVPGSTGAPLLEGSGGRVVAGYDPELLREMARSGGGGFHELTTQSDADALIDELRSLGGRVEAPQDLPFDP
ncbi:MAG: VWA domain-containing protein, partial [Longimicrobiales bacterium]|nr:VWA domain-containing protein [Longimicrobiales bacterium]